MFGSIYNGLTGLLGFSKGLDVLSHNIANLNTPGFKASELAFRDLFYRYSVSGGNGDGSFSQVGCGVDTPSTSIRYRTGESRETGNSLDAAIDGSGFFVLRKDGELFYTRAGQFEIDGDGYLTERMSGARVMAIEGSSALRDINTNDLRSSAPKPTSAVTFVGNLSQGGATHEVKDIAAYDILGGAHQLTIKFINNNSVTSGSWLVEVRDQGGTTPTAVIASGEIRYQGNGSPLTGYNTVTFDYAPSGVTATAVTLNFGDPGTFSGTTNFSGGTTSDLKTTGQDGYAPGALSKTTFDEKGYLKLSYSNGQTVTGKRLALAWFRDLQKLKASGGGMFVNDSDQKAVLYGATENVMGKILPGKIELSNVELTEQFTDMVIIQRGYQASSQVTSVANEMIQQLLEIRRRG